MLVHCHSNLSSFSFLFLLVPDVALSEMKGRLVNLSDDKTSGLDAVLSSWFSVDGSILVLSLFVT